MLVLSRKVGEAIVVDDKTVIRVLSNAGGKISLGIEGPREIPVLREELFLRDKEKVAESVS